MLIKAAGLPRLMGNFSCDSGLHVFLLSLMVVLNFYELTEGDTSILEQHCLGSNMIHHSILAFVSVSLFGYPLLLA